MKGQSMELIEILALVICSSILIVSSYFFFNSRIPVEAKLSTEQHEYDKVAESVKNFLYTKIPIIDKTYAQLLGDLIVNDAKEVVDYGDKYGGINVTKIVYEYYDSYFDGSWHLKVSSKKEHDFGYGVPSGVRIRTFIIKFPVPSYIGGVIKFEFKQW